MKILIVEDEPQLSDILRQSLGEAGYETAEALTYTGGEQAWHGFEPNLVILDLMLPDGDGLDLLRAERDRGDQTPVLILTAKDALPDRVAGLDSGADDYLTKPFAFTELLARVRALLRRSALPFEPVLHKLDLQLDRVRHVVSRNGRTIDLTPKEFALLEYLMLNEGSNVSRSSIIHHVWKLAAHTTTNVVDVYINYVRKKIDQGFEHKLIHTIRGVGYQIGEEV